MAQANDSILVTPGSGATVATHDVGSKEHQVIMEAEASGHILGSIPTYWYWSEPGATANLQRQFTLWNGSGSGKLIKVRKLFIANVQTGVVTGVACRFNVRRITAEPASQVNTLTAVKMDTNNAAVPAQITGKNGSVAAHAGDILFGLGAATEEVLTGQGVHAAVLAAINWLPESRLIQDLILREGEGLDVQFATNTTTGLFGVLCVFTLE